MNEQILQKTINEFQELNDRITKLREFILDTEEFNKLDNLNKDLLIAQLKAMESYISILSIRIGLNAKVDSANTEETVSNVEESK
jgi:hypothetical protein